MTPAQWSALSPAERAAYTAQYGPPPAHYQQTANPYPTTTAAAPAVIPAPKRRRKWPWVLAVLAVLIVLGSLSGRPASTRAVGPQPAAPAAAQPASDTQPAAPAGPATSVGDGTYQVGTDMAAGRYKTPGPPADAIVKDCYWQRTKDDSGQFDAIIANGNATGPGSVTIKAGEFFETSGGCTWTKQ